MFSADASAGSLYYMDYLSEAALTWSVCLSSRDGACQRSFGLFLHQPPEAQLNKRCSNYLL